MSDKPPVILVAEDDKSVRLVVQQALARQGYNVQSSGNAAGLWKLIASGRGDVLITDVALPVNTDGKNHLFSLNGICALMKNLNLLV